MRGGYVHHPDWPVRGPLDRVLPFEDTGWDLHLVFTDDGLYAPALARFPDGPGPHPAVICLHPGSGGLGLPFLADHVREQASLLERLLGEGLGVVVAEGRAEQEDAYGRPDAGVLDHDDVVAVFRHVAALPEVDDGRVAFLGVSHGGELQLKATAAMGGGPAALVPAEPAVIELLGLRYPGARVEAELQYNRDVGDDELDLDRALERLRRIPADLPILVVGRDDDHLQGLFRKLAELLERTGHAVEFVTFDHPEHAYQFGPRRTEAGYEPDPVTRATHDAITAFLVRRLR
jgi:dienelactone hydrolase